MTIVRFQCVIREMGNPFKDDFAELVTLNTRNCMEEAVVSTVRNIESLGETKYHEYMNDVVEQRPRSIHGDQSKAQKKLSKLVY